MKDYPFNKCLHPKQIINPYTKQPITVNCGQCTACQLHKSSVSALKCRLESLSHNYTMFVTLTYNESSCPRAIAFYDENTKLHIIKDNTPRFAKYKDIYHQELGEVSTSPSDMELLRQKFQNRQIPYLFKKDLQLFIKRLRKNLSKYTHEKIRYYACGEYGPKHYRPHFHLLVWFSEAETYTNFYKALCQSWKFGRVDSQVSRGKSSSYVAQYLNSSCNLPQVHRLPQSKQFSCHSSRLGEGVLRQVRKDAYELPYNDFIHSCVQLDAQLQDVYLWRSLESWYFPQCRNYAREFLGSRKYAYLIYRTAFEWTREVSPYRQAKEITQYVYEHHRWHFVPEFERLLAYFFNNQRFSCKKICRNDKDMYEQFFHSIYRDLYISKHFLQTVCDTKNQTWPTMDEINRKLNLIDEHYKARDYDCLKRQYEYTDLLLQSHMYEDEKVFFSDDFHQPKTADVIPYLYDNVQYDINNYNETPLPLMFKQDVTKRSYESVKHKLQNDLNQQFDKL